MMKAYLESEGSHSHCVCELEGKLAAGVQRNGGSDGAVVLQVVEDLLYTANAPVEIRRCPVCSKTLL